MSSPDRTPKDEVQKQKLRSKQYESSLQESEKLFHIQVEEVKDYAIFMIDSQGNVLNWNSGAERLKGYRAEEIIGKHFSCFYPEEDRARGKPADELKKAVAEGRVEDEGWRIQGRKQVLGRCDYYRTTRRRR